MAVSIAAASVALIDQSVWMAMGIAVANASVDPSAAGKIARWAT